MRRARTIFWIPQALLCLSLGSGCEGSTDPAPRPEEVGPAIVLMIGDGMGEGALTAARLRAGSLAMEQLPVRGMMRTASATDSVTDSGAAATALATGVLTYNGAIGVGPEGSARETLLEAAERRGMATGLVATSSVTHATPASFAAHVARRAEEMEIAQQMARSGVDVLLGGGRRYFRERPDGEDLVRLFQARDCLYVTSGAQLPSSPQGSCLLGLFEREAQMRVLDRRTPTLPQMSLAALSVLQQNPKGFFLMIEGSQIDWAGHQNDGEWSVTETLDFDVAVAAVRQALEGRPNTLLIVTADHETGGLSASRGAGGEVLFQWRSRNHTGAPVPLHAWGRGAEGLAGTHAIDAVGRYLRQRLAGP